MPTYEYVCKTCEHRFEKRQSFSAKPLRTCPECSQKTLQKVIFPTGVVFKGSGFYVNDSRSAASSTSSDSGASNGTSKEPKKESKSEAKQDSAKKKSAKASKDD
ncbi:MAG: zinc ribbon domain-containing protein [Acidimicrobiia bacterium]|nr:zinc ribbon domain-containing protein [Acidimicrobiia bacterium]